MKAPDDPLLPPGLAPHLLHPRVGDVPVVVDVVVVEDHRARHGRQQPADVRIAPRLAVEPRVLLEVGDLVARRLRDVAAAPDEGARLGRDLVGVDLVAQQQQAVGPWLPSAPAVAARGPRARPPRSPPDARRWRACRAAAAAHRPGTTRTRAGPAARGSSCGWRSGGARRRGARPARRRGAPRTATPRPARGRRSPRGRSDGPRRERCGRCVPAPPPRRAHPSPPRRWPVSIPRSAGGVRGRGWPSRATVPAVLPSRAMGSRRSRGLPEDGGFGRKNVLGGH